MKETIRISVVLLGLLTFATGVVYPLVVTAIARVVFPTQAHGNIVTRDGRAVGSRLVGQHFSSPRYFWARPSATAPMPYNAAASAGSNLGPLNPELRKRVQARIDELRLADPAIHEFPADLVTSSASGLDPHISPAAARVQVPRVARARGLTEEDVKRLVGRHTEGPQWGIFGQPRVNVLLLNLSLDERGSRP